MQHVSPGWHAGNCFTEQAAPSLARILPPKVLRDSRLRVASAGMPFTETEQSAWKRQITDFFGTAAEDTPLDAKKRAKREKFTVPRLASYDWLMSVENALRFGAGKGFERFTGSDHDLERDIVPATLVLTMDQAQLQWSALNYLTHGPPKLCCVGLFDPFHRRHNDIEHAMNRSGFTGYFVHARRAEPRLRPLPELRMDEGLP